jgi:GNAT superfamily N-acetyltransferase
MVNEHIYKEKIPEIFHCQILSFIRIIWPSGFVEGNRLRNWVSKPEYHSVTFILEEEEILISHVAVVWKMLEHKGKTYKTYGLSGVFTYPQFRKQGYAERLIKLAKDYIETETDADIVLFTTCVIGLYDKLGFEKMETTILEGDPKSPAKSIEIPYMLFLSEKGKENRKDFESGSVYFGRDLW